MEFHSHKVVDTLITDAGVKSQIVMVKLLVVRRKTFEFLKEIVCMFVIC